MIFAIIDTKRLHLIYTLMSTGDKRSYEVLAELMDSLRDSQPIIEAVSSSIGVFATSVKCQLLLSMLHHQLKVTSNTINSTTRNAIVACRNPTL